MGEKEEGKEGRAEEVRKDQEEALVALMEQYTKNLDFCRQRLSYYTSQLHQAERSLVQSQQKLACLRDRVDVTTSTSLHLNDLNYGARSMSPIQLSDDSSESPCEYDPEPDKNSIMPPRKSSALDQEMASTLKKSNDKSRTLPQETPPLIIPLAEVKVSQPLKMDESSPLRHGSDSCAGGSSFAFRNSIVKLKADKSVKPPQAAEVQQGMKRKFEQRESKELIPLIARSSSVSKICCQTHLMQSQHSRKLRTIVLCPKDDQLFATSALDGVVNLWQVQDRGSSANRLSSSDCLTSNPNPKFRKWPEDIAWHPEGISLFSVYNADDRNSQVSILKCNEGNQMQVKFLEEKPHTKGNINNIMFMPWKDDYCFVTGGSDHAVLFWTSKDGEDSWKPEELHTRHSSAVMGVAGLHHKRIVMSAGADKHIFGFDLSTKRLVYDHQLENKCMSVLPNPRDFNLFMVQTGTLEKQLRLMDFRLKPSEIHTFGWKQESSEAHSALISQAWSPDGLYISSGSVDPDIHIFDIRYNLRRPFQSIRAHQRRVFKAVWHHALPLLISISSDTNIGFHKIV